MNSSGNVPRPGGRMRRPGPCRPGSTLSFSRSYSAQTCNRVREAIDGYALGIVRLIGESYGRDTVQRAWREFTHGKGKVFRGYEPDMELFFSWLFHHWVPQRERGDQVHDETLYGVPPTRAYLDRNSLRLNPLLCKYLEVCLVTSPGFYQILKCRPGVSFRVRNVLTGGSCEVNERLASTSIRKGSVLYAHLVPIDRITVMDAISPVSFPPSSTKHLTEMYRRRQLRQRASVEMRELYFTLLQLRCGDGVSGISGSQDSRR